MEKDSDKFTQDDKKTNLENDNLQDLDSFLSDNQIEYFSQDPQDAEDVVHNYTDDDLPANNEDLHLNKAEKFNDFKMGDLDFALKSYQAARRGKVYSVNDDKNQIAESAKTVPSEASVKPLDNKSGESKKDNVLDNMIFQDDEFVQKKDDFLDNMIFQVDESEKKKDDFLDNMIFQDDEFAQKIDDIDLASGEKANPIVVDESESLAEDIEEPKDILKWYSGKLNDKCYEISFDNMPEFLDSDKTIRVINVNVPSTYGWNVFFDNGVFMNLQDLKTYQIKHGKLPYNSGKIVYGNKTSQFENISKIVVYELPRYFSYKPE